MTLFTQTQTKQLLANCDAQVARMDAGQPDLDFKPVVKLFTPDAQCTWLLTELGRDDIALGLCDLGMGFPELGFVSMTELRCQNCQSRQVVVTFLAPDQRTGSLAQLFSEPPKS